MFFISIILHIFVFRNLDCNENNYTIVAIKHATIHFKDIFANIWANKNIRSLLKYLPLRK